MKNQSSLVLFDWAMKRLLRQKSNFDILEGFLSTLLGESIHIVRILESEGNKEDSSDKFNRVDILAEDDKKQLIIIEVQNNRELDYFHRMLYGASKAITEYIHESEQYGIIRKVYSVNIVYFDLGQGKDYVYHGKTSFKGLHCNDVLRLSARQRKQFVREDAGDIFPEYYVLRVNEFDELAKTPLDEWISFLKTGEIDERASAQGLAAAREKLKVDQLSSSEKAAYYSHLEALRYQKSVIQTSLIEGRDKGMTEGLAKGKAEGFTEGKNEARHTIARNMKQQGFLPETISQCTGLSIGEISEL